MPGLAANSKIFDRIRLPIEQFELHYLEWIMPTSIDESIEKYAKRMCEYITEKECVLIGVSFGGILVQEMSKIITIKQLIIISSIKNNRELPKRLQLAKVTKAYKLFPKNNLSSLENIVSKVFGKMAQKRIEQYRIFLSVRNPLYLKWAIYTSLHWKQEESLSNILHIHGTQDHIFPIKNISNCNEIEGGTHVMILNRAKEISSVLLNSLN